MLGGVGLACLVLLMFALRQNLLVVLGVATAYIYLVFGDGVISNIVVGSDGVDAAGYNFANIQHYK